MVDTVNKSLKAHYLSVVLKMVLTNTFNFT